MKINNRVIILVDLMRLDEIDFEESIKDYSDHFKEILRKSRKQADEMCKRWEESRHLGLDEPHPLEISLGMRIDALHDDRNQLTCD